jgi:spoIIIJ-associated protein
MSNETTPAETGTADSVTEEVVVDGSVEAEQPDPAPTGSADGEPAGVTDAEALEVEAAEIGAGDAEAVDLATDQVAADAGEPVDADHEAPTGAGRRAQLEREGEVAADFLETLLDICDLDGDLDVDIDGDRAAVAIVDSDEGRVPRRLVGADAQVLEALQELTRLAVQSETGERSRLMLDVAGHRAERRAELVALAAAAIEEVRASGERKSLTPMTAFERKVVHDEVLAAGLVSESEGSEPRRFVVIAPS